MISGKRLRAVIFASVIVVVLILTLLVEKNRVSAAGIFTVTNTNDAGTGSLREAITGANSLGDGLIDATGVSGTIDLLTALPALDGNITFNGPGAASLTVERSFAGGTPSFSIFTIDFSRTVTINGLMIKNGSVSGDGGGIVNQGTVTVNNTTVANNSTSGVFGGGIFNTGTLTVINSTIVNNSAGNIGAGGGICSVSGGTMVVINSTIANNSAPGGGGGIFTAGNSATISACTIANNSAAGGGGSGILNQSGTLTVSNSSVLGNFDTGGGGGGIFNQGTGTVSDSTIADNSVVLNIGGGIVNQGTLTIGNSTVANNSSDSIFGGGGIANFGALTVNNSTVTNNSATGGGGIAQFLGSVNLQSTIVAKNSGANPDVSGAFTSLGHNLIGDTAGNSGYDISLGDLINLDPLFQLDGFGKPLLANNGGPTSTVALLLGSPASDHGRNLTGLLTDQRGPGFPRTYDDPAASNGDGDGTDIGAFELQPPCNPMAFDLCLQDDSTSSANLLISTLTGDYRFACGGQIVIGKGLVIVRGSFVTLQDYSGNRRVLAKVDKSAKRATASLQVAGATCTITDRDITNDSCNCSAQ